MQVTEEVAFLRGEQHTEMALACEEVEVEACKNPEESHVPLDAPYPLEEEQAHHHYGWHSLHELPKDEAEWNIHWICHCAEDAQWDN